MAKNILLGIAFLGLAFAGAKSYHVTFSEAYTVGTAQLKAGDYKVVVNGTTAALEDERGKVEANGTIESAKEKFEETAVVSNNTNGMAHIRAIELGGTRSQVEFK